MASQDIGVPGHNGVPGYGVPGYEFIMASQDTRS